MLTNELKDFQQWNEFVESIRERVWSTPIGLGKWTIHEIVSHIALWDKYFLEAAIEPICSNQPITLKHLNYDQFNNEAAAYGKTLTKDELIDLTKQYRNRIIELIRNADMNLASGTYKDLDGNDFTIETYLKDFIYHDLHHRKQIEDSAAISI